MPLIKIVTIHGHDIELTYYAGLGWMTSNVDVEVIRARRKLFADDVTNISKQAMRFFWNENARAWGDMPLDEHGILGRRRS